MRIYRSIPVLIVFVTTIVALGLALSSVPAGSSSRPRVSQAAAMDMSNELHVLQGGFWRTDGGFVSIIRIKNVLVVAPIQISPTLFMADGTAYPLAPVSVASAGVATVNINDALASAPPAVSSHVSQFGSLMLTYTYPTPGHVVATLASIDTPRSLSYVYMINEPMPMPEDNMPKALEGLWWKHDHNVHGIISLANTTDQQRTATVRIVRTNQDSDAREVQLGPHATQVLSLEQISREASGENNRAGGVRVEYSGPSGAVMVSGSLANENIGYSANIPFWAHDPMNESTQAKNFELGSAGIMVGKPDSMMMPGFPAETTFTPYVAVRNTTAKALKVSFRLNYAPPMGGAPPNRQLGARVLGPYQSELVEMKPLLHAAGLRDFSGMINLGVSFTGHGGDLMLATGSVDQTGNYVFEVRPQVIGERIGTISGYWSVANGNDAMFSLWNPSDSPQDLIATLYYGDGSGQYHLPVHLAAQGSLTLDVAMLIMEKTPDRDGKILPASVREGSASFDTAGKDASEADGKKKVTTVIAGGLFNTANATCGMLCQYCNGYNNFVLIPGPIDVQINGSGTVVSHATDSYGNDQTLSGGSWTTTNSSIMTVSSGNVGGVSPGSVTLQNFLSNIIVYQGNFCVSDNMNDACPQGNPAPSGGGDVVKVVISQNTTGNVSSDNAASSNYQSVEGTLSLGAIIGSGTSKGCFMGNQGVGTVTPSSYTGTITLHQQIVQDATFTNSTKTGGVTNQDDTAVAALRDDDPQSGNSNGKIYELDAPGAKPPNDGNTYRYRAHMYLYATLPSGREVSPSEYDFYVAVSCKQTSSGFQFVNDVANDNKITTSPINLTWNLQ